VEQLIWDTMMEHANNGKVDGQTDWLNTSLSDEELHSVVDKIKAAGHNVRLHLKRVARTDERWVLVWFSFE
jgi:hypothetical protein